MKVSRLNLEQVLAHVVAEVFQQRHFLRESIGKVMQRVKMFGSIAFNVLHISITSNSPT